MQPQRIAHDGGGLRQGDQRAAVFGLGLRQFCQGLGVLGLGTVGGAGGVGKGARRVCLFGQVDGHAGDGVEVIIRCRAQPGNIGALIAAQGKT